MSKKNLALQFLEKKGYFVKVERVSPTEFTAHFPPYSLMSEDSPEILVTYKLTDTGINVNGEEVAVPKYARMVAIMADIKAHLHHLSINPKLLIVKEGEQTVDFDSWSDLSEPEKEEESKLKILLNSPSPEQVRENKSVLRTAKMIQGLSY